MGISNNRYGWQCPRCLHGWRKEDTHICCICGTKAIKRRCRRRFVWQTETWEAVVDNPWTGLKIILGLVSMVLLLFLSFIVIGVSPITTPFIVIPWMVFLAYCGGKGMAENSLR